MRTNHDVNVRVQEKVALEGLPSESCLLAVSNAHNLLFAGGNSGKSPCCIEGRKVGGRLTSDVRVHSLSQIHELFETSAKDAQPTATPVHTIALPARPIWVR